MVDQGQRQRVFNRAIGVVSLIAIGTSVFVAATYQWRLGASRSPAEKLGFDASMEQYRARKGVTVTHLREALISYACRFPEFDHVTFSYSGTETVRRTEPEGVTSVGSVLALEQLEGLNVKRPVSEGRLHSLPSRLYLFDRPGERLPNDFSDRYAEAVDYALVDGRVVPVRRLVLAQCVRR